ncbi:MAG TPA: translation initiation factor IF-3 [Acidimicrobiia bacterium]
MEAGPAGPRPAGSMPHPLWPLTEPGSGSESAQRGPWRRASRVRRRFASAPTTTGEATLAADDTRINDRIRARQVLLIGSDGTQYGIKPLPEALSMSREQGFDLVEVAANADPPVCRIMDFGKWKYEQDQRRKESRKRATNVVIKEMKFRPKIDGHDFETKMKHVERFLGEGSKVKLTIMFRGREMAHPEIGRRILERVAETVTEYATVESAPRQDGRNMTMVLNPLRKPGVKPKPKTQEPPSEAALA